MPESNSEAERMIARQEADKPLEVVEAVSAEAQDPAEKPAEDPQQRIQARIDEIDGSLKKFDDQLFEFSDKLEDPNLNADAKEVIEKVMRLIAEQQTALVNEREEIKLTSSPDAGVIDLRKTQIIPAMRRQTQEIKLPQESPPELPPELPADALTELPPELPEDALTELPPELPANAQKPADESYNLYRALEGTPAEAVDHATNQAAPTLGEAATAYNKQSYQAKREKRIEDYAIRKADYDARMEQARGALDKEKSDQQQQAA